MERPSALVKKTCPLTGSPVQANPLKAARVGGSPKKAMEEDGEDVSPALEKEVPKWPESLSESSGAGLAGAAGGVGSGGVGASLGTGEDGSQFPPGFGKGSTGAEFGGSGPPVGWSFPGYAPGFVPAQSLPLHPGSYSFGPSKGGHGKGGEPSLSDIMYAVQTGNENVDQKFMVLQQQYISLKSELGQLRQYMVTQK